MRWLPALLCLCWHPLRLQLWAKPSSQPVCQQLHLLLLCQVIYCGALMTNPACGFIVAHSLREVQLLFFSLNSLQRRQWAAFCSQWVKHDMLCNLTCIWSAQIDLTNRSPSPPPRSVSEVTAAEKLTHVWHEKKWPAWNLSLRNDLNGTYQCSRHVPVSNRDGTCGAPLKTCRVGVDNVFIYSGSFSERLQHLIGLPSRFQSHGLKLNPSKWCLATDEVEYLGPCCIQNGFVAYKTGLLHASQRFWDFVHITISSSGTLHIT